MEYDSGTQKSHDFISETTDLNAALDEELTTNYFEVRFTHLSLRRPHRLSSVCGAWLHSFNGTGLMIDGTGFLISFQRRGCSIKAALLQERLARAELIAFFTYGNVASGFPRIVVVQYFLQVRNFKIEFIKGTQVTW